LKGETNGLLKRNELQKRNGLHKKKGKKTNVLHNNILHQLNAHQRGTLLKQHATRQEKNTKSKGFIEQSNVYNETTNLQQLWRP